MDLLLVGLGNPGPRYSLTRHNAGFIFADYLAHGLGLSFQQKSSWQAEYASGEWMNSKIHILKPQTFMNLSGKSVAAFLRNSNLSVDNIVVAQDEVEIPFGQIRFKKGGGDAGHNGLKSLREDLGSGEFYRLRMGVGRSTNPQQDLADHVLSRFTKNEEDVLMKMLQGCEDVLSVFLKEGLQKAQMKASQI